MYMYLYYHTEDLLIQGKGQGHNMCRSNTEISCDI